MAEMLMTTYPKIRDRIRNGDCFVWNSRGHSIMEKLYVWGIRLVTGPVTHISTAIWTYYPNGLLPIRSLSVWESVAQGQIFDSLDRQMAVADGLIEAWWLPMSEERRAKLDEQKMIEYMVRKVHEGTQYDLRGAIRSARDRRDKKHNNPDDTELFCSESHLFALLNGGAIIGTNPSEAYPMNVVEMDIHAPTYYQFYGERKELENVGTVKADYWDV